MTKQELVTISKIAGRAVQLAAQHGISYQHIDAMIDLEKTHEQNPLRLDEFLKADDGNFAHDVFGIRQNMNRETGQIENCFSPRYSA